MAANKTIVLITGANAGVGFELASQLLADQSKHILLGSRSLEKGTAAVKDLQARNQPGTVDLVQIDISNEDSIAAAAKKVQQDYGRIDALVNNAGIAEAPGSVPEQMTQIFQTNAIGTYLVVQAFAPLLKNANGTPRILNVSSGQGSIGRRLDLSNPANKHSFLPYRTSKAALNMVTACLVNDFKDDEVRIFSYCPGFTVSGLAGVNKAEHGAKPTSEGAAPMVKILNGERDAEHAGYLNGEGQFPSW